MAATRLCTVLATALAFAPSALAAAVAHRAESQFGAVELPGITLRESYHEHLFKRQREEDENGALLCKNGPCVDGSCCGPAGICGYGPDFCGTGCTSDCDAVAMCGEFADPRTDGKCGMNLCCSWGGWCGTSDVHCIGPNPQTPCQDGYGACEIIRPNRCGTGSGSASGGRSIGYYLASNVRERVCNRISPSQIATAGYTHLYFSFASMDPSSYEIKPWVEDDIPLMKEFTALARDGLETWIAVGGYTFSDNNTATHTTWSDMVSTQANRAAFIASTKTFMKEYGFKGIDLDWEYPVAPERGGQLTDVANFVSLVKELREAYGTEYGLSLTLAPDYWYLRYFDAKAMEPYVDWFGFMAYDLHGSWDTDVKTLGSLVRGQADIREIENNTLPLFYAGIDPGKINFGLAWYGRGYTLSDPSCNELLCPFSGPSKPATCTNSAGVMSLTEIEALIKEKNLTPRLNQDSMMKELVWDDQWIGYDDEETHDMKRGFANDMCFGGTMFWSVDFYSGSGSGDTAPKSNDGRCGPDYGGATCPGSGFGTCCSSGGWCGSSDAHCGSGCLGGKCLTGGETSDGTCGAGHGDTWCGMWAAGGCCSSSGFCGNTDAHCGAGCQSGACQDDPVGGGGSGPIYIDPEILTDPSPTVSCYPPCEYILPPRTLDGLTTITPAPFTTSLQRGSTTTTRLTEDGTTYTFETFVETTVTTVITVPPITTSIIKYWDITVTGNESTSTVWPMTSILPPEFVITLSSTDGLQEATRTITPRPWPWPTKEPVPDDDDDDDDDHDDSDWHFPHVIGPPGPLCQSGCTSHCRIFCDKPCLLSCGGTDGGGLSDWWDPSNPNRPATPPPSPGPGDPDDPDDDDDDDDEDEEPQDPEGDVYHFDWEYWEEDTTSDSDEEAAIDKVLDALEDSGFLDDLEDDSGGDDGGDGDDDNNDYEKVPDCIFVWMIQWTDKETHQTAVGPDVVFGPGTRCTSGVWCDEENLDEDNLWCKGGTDLDCNDDMKMRFSTDKIGWSRIDMSDPSFRGGEQVSFQIPYSDTDDIGEEVDCPTTYGFQKDHRCWRWDYGAYVLDGTCENRAVELEAELDVVPKKSRKDLVI